jgi:hypothetical protein
VRTVIFYFYFRADGNVDCWAFRASRSTNTRPDETDAPPTALSVQKWVATVCMARIGWSYQMPNSKLGLPSIRRNCSSPKALSVPSSCHPLPRHHISFSSLSQPTISSVIRRARTWSFCRFSFVPYLSRFLCFVFGIIDEVVAIWWRIGIKSLWPFLPWRRSFWHRRMTSWFSLDIDSWCAYLGK